jgi:ribA/ribD-fused uncharacterized protein
LDAPTAKDCKAIARHAQESDIKNGLNSIHWQKWERIKVDVMRLTLEHKFSDPHLRQRLLDTGTDEIIEDSPDDSFWGGSLPGGLNTMGKLLMEHREKLRGEGGTTVPYPSKWNGKAVNIEGSAIYNKRHFNLSPN